MIRAIALIAFLILFSPAIAFAQAAPPSLYLPTPPGETWRVIQGYACGTHDDAGDAYALDLIAADGDTFGAPVRAAASGVVLAWVEPSGTLLIDHGNGFLTQYTHMEPLLTTRGTLVGRGSIIGYVGERGTIGNPHLHFALLQQQGFDRSTRQSVPLRFVDGAGYDLPALGGCSQHQNRELIAEGPALRWSRLIVRQVLADEAIYCPLRGACVV